MGGPQPAPDLGPAQDLDQGQAERGLDGARRQVTQAGQVQGRPPRPGRTSPATRGASSVSSASTASRLAAAVRRSASPSRGQPWAASSGSVS